MTEAQDIAKTLTLTVPPHTSIRSKLMVRMARDVAIPFVATIKQTRNRTEKLIKQRGTWNGVLLTDSFIENSDAPALTSRNGAERMRFTYWGQVGVFGVFLLCGKLIPPFVL